MLKFIIAEEDVERGVLVELESLSDHLHELLECELSWDQVPIKLVNEADVNTFLVQALAGFFQQKTFG